MKRENCKWTKPENDKLTRIWIDPSCTKEQIQAAFPGIQWNTLKKQASRLKLKKGKAGICDANLPGTNFENPFVIKCKNPNNPKIMALNSPFIGVEQNYDGYNCLFRNALQVAAMDGCDAVIISGNLFYIDTVRFSNLKPLRSRVAGIKPREDLLNYPKTVLKEMGSIDTRIARGDLIYMPFKQKLDHVAEMARVAFHDIKGEIIFKKPIYVCFGNVEEMLASWLANEEIRSRLIEEQSLVASIIRDLKADLSNAADENKTEIEGKIKDYEEYRQVFLKMTNVADFDVYFIFNNMRQYIVNKIHSIAKNIKVIGTGKTFIKIGQGRSEKIIKISHRPNESEADTYLGKVLQDTRESISHGKKQPSLILLGGTNTQYTSLPISYQTKKGVTSVVVAQLPTAVDGRLLGERVSKGIKKGNILFKLTESPNFECGVMILEWVDGVPKEKKCTGDFLTNASIFESKKKIEQAVKGKHTIYGEVEGDEHCGHKFVAYYKVPCPPYIIFHGPLMHEFLKNAPLCFYFNVGDMTQGHNHEYEREVHPEWRPDYLLTEEIEKISNYVKEKFPAEKYHQELQKRTEELLFKNSLFAGILLATHQIESYIKTRIMPCLDYFYNIIQRAKKINLDNRGTVGIITYLSGNHFMNTHLGEFCESKIFAQKSIDELLKKYPDLNEKDLRELILAPMLANIALSEGVIGINPEAKQKTDDDIRLINEPYYYAISAKHKQGDGSSKLADSARPMRESVGKRGTTVPWFEDRFIIFLSGHTHYGGVTSSENSLFVRSGSQTFHDPYGEKCNFPLNNISTEIIGLPKDGPHTGPITLIHLRFEDFIDYGTDPWEVDINKLFSNSII